jgi:glycine/D-amino acid oxidase-like deaminating enzyme
MKHYSSYWERSVLLRKFDFLILGAGIIGKQIALKIRKKNPNARIGIVDRSPISYGASTRNAGFACFGSVSEIVDDFKRSSQHEVMSLLNKRFQGIQQLVQTFGADQIGYRNTGSYEIYTDQEEYQDARNHFQTINQLIQDYTGQANAFQWQKSDKLQMTCFEDCLFNPLEGMINSGMLNETISELTHKAGIIPLYGLNITSLNKNAGGYTLIADNDLSLSCSQLIIATNAFSSQLMPELDVVPARGQIILTKPIDDLPFDGIFHNDKGYIYFRNIDDRVLLGGARNYFEAEETTYDFEGSSANFEHLKKYMQEIILPGRSFEIDMHWSGIMAMGEEKIPIVKKVDDHLTLCVRMSGMGVALGPVLSDEVAAFFD